jgi:hypothetical protein
MQCLKTDLGYGHKEVCRKAAVSAQYSETARQVAAEVPGVVLVDLQKALMEKAISMTPDYDPSGPPLGYPEGGKRGALEQLLPDGLHMSGEAYRVFFEIVKPHIILPPDNYYVYPDWRISEYFQCLLILGLHWVSISWLACPSGCYCYMLMDIGSPVLREDD